MKKKEFKIITVTGIRDAVKPFECRFKSPKWLSRYRFFTHLTHTPNKSDGWTLTEASSGRAVISLCETRVEARRDGREKIIVAGRSVFLKAIKARPNIGGKP